eukprot:4635160-Amphidinium_carterae.1
MPVWYCDVEICTVWRRGTPGRDGIWSNNQNGSGKNWLGMQLMLVRDKLAGTLYTRLASVLTEIWVCDHVKKLSSCVKSGELEKQRSTT